MSTLVAASGPMTMWYLMRGTGVVSLLLLTGAVVLGILCAVRWRADGWPRFLVGGLHRNVTLVAVAFVVVHVISTVADGYAPVGLKDAVVPFLSSYRPVWLGLGAVAFDLLLALVITSLLRARLGIRLWRGVHWLAYASWPVALVHGLGTGSDSRFGWLGLIAFGCAAAVAAAVLVRVAASTPPAGARVITGAAAVVVPLLIFVWYLGGPRQHGWAARAGTPASLLRGTVSDASAQAVTATTQSSSRIEFDGRLLGRVTESLPNAQGIVAVDISGRVSGGVDGTLRLILYGVRTEEGGVALTSSRVFFSPSGRPRLAGTVVELNGTSVVASLSSNTGDRTSLALQLHVDSTSGRVRGIVHGSPA